MNFLNLPYKTARTRHVAFRMVLVCCYEFNKLYDVHNMGVKHSEIRCKKKNTIHKSTTTVQYPVRAQILRENGFECC